MGASPLKYAFPKLFALSDQKDASIAHCWNQSHEAWNLGVRRNLNEFEISEWSVLSTYYWTLITLPEITHGDGSWTNLGIFLPNRSLITLPLPSPFRKPSYLEGIGQHFGGLINISSETLNYIDCQTAIIEAKKSICGFIPTEVDVIDWKFEKFSLHFGGYISVRFS